jgi:hypothetical protein
VGLRNITNTTPTLYCGLCIPNQGTRKKTAEFKAERNHDFPNELFEFGIPTKNVSGLQVSVFESTKHPYTNAWSEQATARGYLKWSRANDNDGLIRGSPTNDEWISLDTGGHAIVRIAELFRFQVRIISGKGIKSTSSPYVLVQMDTQTRQTCTISNDPARDRTMGVKGEPRWDEQFTLFAHEKRTVTLRLMDDTIGPDSQLGKAVVDLTQLRRGIPHVTTVQLDQQAGTIELSLLEEEKMALMDRLLDEAANARKLAAAIASAIADSAKEVGKEIGSAASDVAGAVGSAFSGIGTSLFGK